MAIEIPESLRTLAEDTIKSVFDKNFPAPDLKPLHDWYEDDGWDEVVMSTQGGCVDLKSLAADYFHDYEITDDLGSEDIEITDQMRLSYARALLENRVEESEDGIQAVELRVPSLPSVFLDCFIKGQGQGGWEVCWGATYKSVQELLDSYKNIWVTVSRDVSDEDLLKLWNRDE
jgi:hypothetical protein